MPRQKPSIPAAPELRLLAITRHRRMSSAVADVLAELCFGPERRDHHAQLLSIVASRTGSSQSAGLRP